ncbi:SH3 domain-containing protein [Aureimonas phyllosphaerae]|uniref:SH3 domain-containing protein n=1 Tax=Aureimonas phyllosphaerae TaxID=1166078 RepID=A0A7W6BX21_9HYPH|nr:SH3 domain-containing protein [Aureimonas phyllosphaerae]MBB3936265.1 hypothetical protein [Aureimonas phyllosphaerae]MBB3960010.1 hypothetical protein [Aureimonas phyllosphaerae]SFF47501.1 SH3 domain-containing protein [Aureimonas phyllosphaerae]
MTQRKPRSRKGAKPRAPAGRRVGPVWWGLGILAVGWIAFDANRAVVERHVPQVAALERMLTEANAPATAHRDAAPRRPAVTPAAVDRPRSAEPRAPEARQAALRPPAANPPPPRAAVPDARPASAAAAPAPAPAARTPVAVPAKVERAAPAGDGRFVTRSPTPLRRSPSAGAPAWMVLDAGRPLRVTRREGGFARVESGIFTGWVDAAVVPEAVTPSAAPAPVRSTTMPTLAAADARRGGPVPAASVPGR